MTKFEFQPFDKVLVRDSDEENWGTEFYSHFDNTETIFCHKVTGDCGWAQCLPYNETTKHLCGTSDPYVDPTDFEIGDTVSFRYTERTTGCGEIVGVTGDTFKVSVSGGVYPVDRKRLKLVRKGEKKVYAPTEIPAFEFGDVVKVSFPGEPSYKGIFSRANNETGEARCNVLLKMGDKTWYNMEIPLSYVTLVRKGNFND